MAKWFGTNFPFYKGVTAAGTTGVAARQEDHRLIKNDLIQGLMTIKGERLFRPGFGGDIGRFVFDQNDSQSFTALETSIRDQIGIFHPRIIVNRIDIKEDSSNSNALIVNIYGRTNLDNSNSNSLIFTFQIPVSGTLSNSRANQNIQSNGA